MVELTGNRLSRARIYVTVTSAAYLPTLREDAREGETNWSMNRYARRGDTLLLYVKKPVMAVVAVGSVGETPALEEDPAATWFGQYFADVFDLRLLTAPLTRDHLMETFPDWGYWKQPRQSVRVPSLYESRVRALLEDHEGRG